MKSEFEGKFSLAGSPAMRRVHGVETPMFPKQRQIVFNGVRVGYCELKPGTNVGLIRHYPQDFVQACYEYVESELRAKFPDYKGPLVRQIQQPVSPERAAELEKEIADEYGDGEEDD